MILLPYEIKWLLKTYYVVDKKLSFCLLPIKNFNHVVATEVDISNHLCLYFLPKRTVNAPWVAEIWKKRFFLIFQPKDILRMDIGMHHMQAMPQLQFFFYFLLDFLIPIIRTFMNRNTLLHSKLDTLWTYDNIEPPWFKQPWSNSQTPSYPIKAILPNYEGKLLYCILFFYLETFNSKIIWLFKADIILRISEDIVFHQMRSAHIGLIDDRHLELEMTQLYLQQHDLEIQGVFKNPYFDLFLIFFRIILNIGVLKDLLYLLVVAFRVDIHQPEVLLIDVDWILVGLFEGKSGCGSRGRGRCCLLFFH